MATLMCNMTGKAARAVIWLVMLVVVFQRVFPFMLSNSLHLWILIKRRKFIYLILNFVIISILISSSSFTPRINNLLLKLHRKSKLQKLLLCHDSSSDGCRNYNAQNVVDPSDDDTWWLFTPLDHHQPTTTEAAATTTTATTTTTAAEDENEENQVVEEEARNNGVEEEIVEEDDSLEATWKAIMKSKEKESGPQLKKNDRCTYGDGGEHERRKEKVVGLSKYRARGDLKKWQNVRDTVEKKEILRNDEGGGGGGAKHGWMKMKVALTFHDDLKKRADAFIARVTHDIHLQRLESDQRFLDMINRGL